MSQSGAAVLDIVCALDQKETVSNNEACCSPYPCFRPIILISRIETPGIFFFWSFICYGITNLWFREDLLVMNAEVSGDSATETSVSFGNS